MTSGDTSDVASRGDSESQALRVALVEEGRVPTGIVRHGLIHVALLLVYFLPGGLVWNRLEVSVLGMPLSVFMWWILLPVVIFLNGAFYVRRFWREDQQVTGEVHRVGA